MSLLTENLSGVVTFLAENATYVLILMLVPVLAYSLTVGSVRVGKYPLPPGPWGFPVVEHLPLLGSNPPRAFAQLRQKYGDVFRIRMGSYPTVVLNGIDTIRSALTGRPDDFASRPDLYSLKLIRKLYGGSISFIGYSPVWKSHRRICNSALRTFANYRNNPTEDTILTEGTRLVEFFLQHNGESFDASYETYLSSGSVIYQIMFGKNKNVRSDKRFCKIIKSNEDFASFVGAGNSIDFMPWLRFLLPGRVTRFMEILGAAIAVFKTQLKDHLETFDNNNLRDVMDALIQASNNLTPEEKAMGLTTTRINSAVPDLLGAGIETVGTTLCWAWLHMVASPHVQEKVHAEIDQTIGLSRLPCYQDKKHMPYVEATLLETLRFVSIVPLAIPHETTRDVDLKGYTIPKGTFVFVNLESTCHDPDVWENPYTFNPDRFLSNGVVDKAKSDMFLSFGAGRRRCLGEFLAIVEIFLFFTVVMQKCSIEKVPGETYDLSENIGLTTKPNNYKVIAKPRLPN